MYAAGESTQNLKLAKSYIEALNQLPVNGSGCPQESITQYNEMLSLAYKHLDKALQHFKNKHLE